MAHPEFVDVWVVLDYANDGPAIVDSIWLTFDEAADRVDYLSASLDPEDDDPYRFEVVESFVEQLIDTEKV